MVQIKKENKTEKSQGRGVAGEMAEQLRVHRVVPGSDSQHPHDALHCLELHFQEVQCSPLASEVTRHTHGAQLYMEPKLPYT